MKRSARNLAVYIAAASVALSALSGAVPASAEETPGAASTTAPVTSTAEPSPIPTESGAGSAAPIGQTATFVGHFTKIAREDSGHVDGTLLFRVVGDGLISVDASQITDPLSFTSSSTVTLALPDGVGASFAEVSAYSFHVAALTVTSVSVKRSVVREMPTAEMVNQSPTYKDSHKIFAVLVTPGNVVGGSAESNQTDAKVAAAVTYASSYWSSQSTGLVSFALSGVVPWYKSTFDCTTDQGSSDLWNEARTKATEQLGFIDAQDAHLVLFFPSSSDCGAAIGLGTVGYSVNAGGYAWVVGTDAPTERATLAHELGHNLSLGHADWVDCSTANPNPGYYGTAGCTLNEYGDVVDVMGSAADGLDSGALSSPQAIRSGLWSSTAYSIAPKGTTTYTLNAVSSNTGKRAIVVEDADGVNYFVEFRNFTGEDAQFAGGSCVSGCTVATAPSVRILRLAQTTHTEYDADYDAPIATDYKGFAGDDSYLVGRTTVDGHVTGYEAGDSFVSGVATGISVSVISVGATSAKVSITRRSNVNYTDVVTIVSDYYYDENFRVGDTFTAMIGSQWGADSYAFQWYRNNSAILGATKQSYTLTSSDVGKCFWVKVTGKSAGRSSVSVEYPYFTCFGPVIAGVIDPGAVHIDNTASTLKAVPTGWTTPRLAYTYQWYRGTTVITGATASTYKPTTADRGKLLKVSVKASRSGFASKSAMSAAADYTLTADAAPVISGTAKVGYTLSVSTPSYSTVGGAAPAATASYQWYRSGVAISGAIASSYALVSADYGKKITAKVTGSLAGYIAHAQTSAATATVVKGQIGGSLAAPIVTHGSSLALTAALAPGAVTEAGVKVAWQWYRGGTAITGATTSTKTLSSSDYGKTISVRATVTKSNYTTVVLSSTPVDYTVYVDSAQPVIVGELAIGQQLSVDEFTVTVDGAEILTGSYAAAYQWYRDSVAISGATNPTYTLAAGDIGKAVSVRLTVTVPGFLSKPATSILTQKLGSSSSSLAGWDAQTQANVSKAGLVLSVSSTGISELGVTQKAQWYRGSLAISGATGLSYTLTSSDNAKLVWVKVTTSKATFTPIVKSSEPTNYTVHTAGTVTFDSATPTVGQTLSVVLPSFTTLDGAYVPDSGQVTYTWYRDGMLISGATGSSRLLTASDYNKRLSVKVTVGAPGFLPLTINSAKTSMVLPV